MGAKVLSCDDKEVVLQVTVPIKSTMLDCENEILNSVNEMGGMATKEILNKFDSDGTPIKVGGVKFTARTKNGKKYQSPYGEIYVNRYVYQTSKGGKIMCPLEERARIIRGATPRFAKTLAHKYANQSAPSVIEDLAENHARKIAPSYLQNVADFVGGVAQAKEEVWEYHTPKIEELINIIGISLDGAHIPTINDGYREGMVGTISLYNSDMDRLHTTYIAAAPEYGKSEFFNRFEREINWVKQNYGSIKTIGIADGAKNNWSFLEKHTDRQVLDFWHASEYLSDVASALFHKKKDEEKRKEWLTQACHELKNTAGAAESLLDEFNNNVTEVKSSLKHHLTKAVSYFSNNNYANRMEYHSLVKDNLPIGSGVTEAACKTIIKQRLCSSGMRWKDNGIKVVLSLRTLVKTTTRWNQFWEKINAMGVPSLN